MSATAASTAVPDYRQILRQHLPQDFFQPDRRTLLWLIPHHAVLFGSLWWLAAHFSWWTAPIVGLVAGHSIACLAVLGHEVCHGAATRTRWGRRLMSALAFGPMGVAPRVWTRWHNDAHHNHTQDRERDPDRLFTLEEYLDRRYRKLQALYRLPASLRRAAVLGFFTVWMTTYNFATTLKYLRPDQSRPDERARILWQFLVPNFFWFGLGALLGWRVFLFGYVLPRLVANVILTCYIVTNHFLNPLAHDEDDVLATSLSVTVPRVLDVLHLRFGAHVAHHFFPTAPARHSRAIEALTARLWPDRYHVMPLSRALKLFFQSNWVYDQSGTRLIDPHRQAARPTLGHGL